MTDKGLRVSIGENANGDPDRYLSDSIVFYGGNVAGHTVNYLHELPLDAGRIVIVDVDAIPSLYAENFIFAIGNKAREMNVPLILLGQRYTHIVGIAMEWLSGRGLHAEIDL